MFDFGLKSNYRAEHDPETILSQFSLFFMNLISMATQDLEIKMLIEFIVVDSFSIR